MALMEHFHQSDCSVATAWQGDFLHFRNSSEIKHMHNISLYVHILMKPSAYKQNNYKFNIKLQI